MFTNSQQGTDTHKWLNWKSSLHRSRNWGAERCEGLSWGPWELPAGTAPPHLILVQKEPRDRKADTAALQPPPTSCRIYMDLNNQWNGTETLPCFPAASFLRPHSAEWFVCCVMIPLQTWDNSYGREKKNPMSSSHPQLEEPHDTFEAQVSLGFILSWKRAPPFDNSGNASLAPVSDQGPTGRMWPRMLVSRYLDRCSFYRPFSEPYRIWWFTHLVPFCAFIAKVLVFVLIWHCSLY